MFDTYIFIWKIYWEEAENSEGPDNNLDNLRERFKSDDGDNKISQGEMSYRTPFWLWGSKKITLTVMLVLKIPNSKQVDKLQIKLNLLFSINDINLIRYYKITEQP